MAAGSRINKIRSKLEGQSHKVILKITVARSLVRCVSADVMGLHVDMAAYVFHLLFTLLSFSSGADRVGL